jgi:hypothetical protein
LDLETGLSKASLFGDSDYSQFGYFVEETTLTIESVPRRVLVVGAPTFTYDSGDNPRTSFFYIKEINKNVFN